MIYDFTEKEKARSCSRVVGVILDAQNVIFVYLKGQSISRFVSYLYVASEQLIIIIATTTTIIIIIMIIILIIIYRPVYKY